MSLGIDPDRVLAVLLVDGWHETEPRSFDIDAYEYVEDGRYVVHGGGAAGVCAAGFAFRPLGTDAVVSGPLTSILAVRCGP